MRTIAPIAFTYLVRFGRLREPSPRPESSVDSFYVVIIFLRADHFDPINLDRLG